MGNHFNNFAWTKITRIKIASIIREMNSEGTINKTTDTFAHC